MCVWGGDRKSMWLLTFVSVVLIPFYLTLIMLQYKTFSSDEE